jgi:hypothetical protein
MHECFVGGFKIRVGTVGSGQTNIMRIKVREPLTTIDCDGMNDMARERSKAENLMKRVRDRLLFMRCALETLNV